MVMEAKNERADWEQNHNAILKAYHYFLFKRDIIPTGTQLAAKTKLSQITISRHLQSIRYDKDSRRERMAPSLELALKGVAKNVILNGDARGAKFLAQYLDDWVETKKINVHNSSPFAELLDGDLDAKLMEPINGISKNISIPPGADKQDSDTVAGDDTKIEPAGENPAS